MHLLDATHDHIGSFRREESKIRGKNTSNRNINHLSTQASQLHQKTKTTLSLAHAHCTLQSHTHTHKLAHTLK